MAETKYMPVAIDPYEEWCKDMAPTFKSVSAANIWGLNHYGFGNYEVIPVGEASKAA